MPPQIMLDNYSHPITAPAFNALEQAHGPEREARMLMHGAGFKAAAMTPMIINRQDWIVLAKVWQLYTMYGMYPGDLHSADEDAA